MFIFVMVLDPVVKEQSRINLGASSVSPTPITGT